MTTWWREMWWVAIWSENSGKQIRPAACGAICGFCRISKCPSPPPANRTSPSRRETIARVLSGADSNPRRSKKWIWSNLSTLIPWHNLKGRQMRTIPGTFLLGVVKGEKGLHFQLQVKVVKASHTLAWVFLKSEPAVDFSVMSQ